MLGVQNLLRHSLSSTHQVISRIGWDLLYTPYFVFQEKFLDLPSWPSPRQPFSRDFTHDPLPPRDLYPPNLTRKPRRGSDCKLFYLLQLCVYQSALGPDSASFHPAMPRGIMTSVQPPWQPPKGSFNTMVCPQGSQALMGVFSFPSQAPRSTQFPRLSLGVTLGEWPGP